jgi:PEGA domain
MTRYVALATALFMMGLNSGCVERTFVITSDPPGAMVYRNGVPLGLTPVDDHFVYYGKYHFTLEKDRCETLQVDEEIAYPWYEFPAIDFVSENIYPFKERDVHRLHYQLKPWQPDNQQDVLGKAVDLRARGKSIASPTPPTPPARPTPQQTLPPAAPPGTPPATMPVGPPATQPPPVAATLQNPR